MKTIVGLCNLHNSPELGQLTSNRPLAATTFLGRYAFIDFPLSNFCNSEIDRVGILVSKFPRAVLAHIGTSRTWNRNTKIGFQTVLYNEKGILNPLLNTDIENLITSELVYKEVLKADAVVIAPCHMITSIDYRPIIKKHFDNNAEVTLVYSHVKNANKQFLSAKVVRFNEDGLIDKIYDNRGFKEEADISLNTYIISHDVLISLIKKAREVSLAFGFDSIIAYMCSRTLKVQGYKFNGYVRSFDSLNNYFNHSFELLKYSNRQKLFLEDWPIYTSSHDTPPTRYGKNAEVANSFIANGAFIDGEVENSIISRNVIIRQGAVIKNSIIFTESDIDKDVELNYCLIDKNAKISDLKNITGSKEEPAYVPHGAKI